MIKAFKERDRWKNHTIYLLLLAGLVSCLALLAWVPPVSRDALIHHLHIPKLYLQHGGFYEIPELPFSYYPMNIDLLYMGILYLGNDILPKYIHMLFGFATALLIYRYLLKNLSPTYAWLGTLFFLSIPIVVKLSITVYVDLGLVFFTTASLLLLFQWLQNSSRKTTLMLAGIGCGLAVGTKYNGLLVLFLLTLFVPVLYIRNTEKNPKTTYALWAAFLFCFCAILIASPWFIRNSIWTSNPVFPLYNGFFNPSPASTTGLPNPSNGLKGVFAIRHVLYGENIWQLLLLPVRIFFQGVDNDPRFFDGQLNPFLFLLPLIAFFYRSKQNKQILLEKTTLLTFCILYFLFAFNTSALRIRYLAPTIPFLIILSMYGLHNIETFIKEHVKNRTIVFSVWLLPISMMFAYNGLYIHKQFQIIEPLSYISGKINRNEYLTQHLPEYKVVHYANTHLPATSKILCVFLGWRGYYFDNDHFFDHHSSSEWLLSWLKESSATRKQIRQHLNEREISHLLIRDDLFDQWLLNAPSHQRSVWKSFHNTDLIPLASHQSYTLYQIAPLRKSALLSPPLGATVEIIR